MELLNVIFLVIPNLTSIREKSYKFIILTVRMISSSANITVTEFCTTIY